MIKKISSINNLEKAFHLSEGKCSLIAFCYFMGKLSDIETKDTKPIIWIDDPVSSLDGNHIFFIYSLIKAEIVHHIYKCSTIDIVDDSNHDIFYNFGNNAKKSLEIYLYYKFPDDSSHYDKMVRFFQGEIIPAILTDRINNELSHLSGGMERGTEPIEVPEMRSAAEMILKRLEGIDKEQYESLLRSIGELEIV